MGKGVIGKGFIEQETRLDEVFSASLYFAQSSSMHIYFSLEQKIAHSTNGAGKTGFSPEDK